MGRQFASAIESYRARSTDPLQTYPRQLEDLLRDDRSITPQYHLRRLYVDPMTGNSQWGLIRLPDGGIIGVHSLSERRPFPRQFVDIGFSPPPALTYREWHFIAQGVGEPLTPVRKPAAPAVAGRAPSLNP